MPSNKEPVTTVQPGPGHLPDGTVSANALDFNPGQGPLTALQAHITNPTGAHAATAISTTVLTGETWSNPAASNVQAALIRAYEGLNARPIWVLDSNPANKGDFVGASAFTNAVTAIGTHRPILFLRSGTYTWSNFSASALDHVTIIGVDQNTVIINSSGAVRFGDHTDVTNVTFTGTAVDFVSNQAHLEHVQLTFTAGLTFTGNGNTLDDVILDASSSALLLNDGNLLKGVSFASSISTLGVGNGNFISDSAFPVDNAFSIFGDGNNFERASFSGGAASSVTGQDNTFSGCSLSSAGDLTIGGLRNRYSTCSVRTTAGGNIVIQDLGGADGAHFFDKLAIDVSGEVQVTTSGCTFLRTDFAPTALGALYIRDIGTNNTYVGVRCSQMGCEGSNGSVRDIEFLSGLKVPGNPTFAVFGNNYLVDGVQFSSLSSVSQSQLNVGGNKNTVKQVDFNSSKSTSQDLMSVFGDGCFVSGVYITAGAQAHVTHAFVRVSGIGSTVDTVHVSGTSFNTGLLSVNGISNTIRNATLDSLTNLNRPMVDIGGQSCVVEQVYATGLSLTAGGTFQIVKMASATNCTVRDIEVTTSPNFGTITDLMQVNGCNDCTFENIYLNDLGATTNVGSAVFRAVSALSTGITIRNINVRNSIFATANGAYIVGIVNLFEINGQFMSKVVMEQCTTDSTVTWTGAGAATILIFNGLSTALAPQSLLTMRDCSLVCTATTYYGVNIQQTMNVLVEHCYFQNTVSTLAALNESSGTLNTQFRDCVFEQSGAGPTATTSEASFEDCTFIGPSTGSGQQLFYTIGGSDFSTSFPKPATIKNCKMLVGSGNINTSGSNGTPLVFFGGFGSGASSNHGTIIVDGLVIKPKPSSGITAWHVGPTLAIDTLNEQVGQKHSYFNNIQIDLQSIAWTSGGFNCTTFSTNGTTNVGVVEIQGPLASVNSAAQSIVNNLSIINISRTGAGNRHIVKAQGANINGLIIDSVQTSAGSSFSTDLVTVQDSRLTALDMFPNHSLPTSTGGTAYVKSVDSVVDAANIRNLRVGASECGYVFNMDGGTLKGSKITAQAGSSWALEAIVMSSTSTPCTVERNRVTVASHAASSGATPPEALRCFGNACKILFNEFYNVAVPTSGSAPNAGGGISFAVQGSNTLIEGNILRVNWYTDTNSTSFFTCTGGAAFTDFVNNIMINDADTVATGFGTAGGSMVATFLNTYGSIVNNTLVGRNTANRISINAAVGGTRRILSNHVENKDTGAGTGTILNAGGDIPTPVASYNIVT